MNFTPFMYVVAARAKQRGATTAEIAPLLSPLSGNAGLMLTAISTIRNQDRLDALSKEIRSVVDDPAKIAELEQSKENPQIAQLLKRNGVKPQSKALDQDIAQAIDQAIDRVATAVATALERLAKTQETAQTAALEKDAGGAPGKK